MARSIKTLIKYLSEAEIIAINEEVVAQYGGLHGVRELHLLQLAVSRPKTSIGFQDAYKTVFDKAAAIFHSILNNHPFLDGNKRTALFSAFLFLEYNRWQVEVRRKEAVKFTIKANNQKWTVVQISQWMEKHSAKIRTLGIKLK